MLHAAGKVVNPSDSDMLQYHTLQSLIEGLNHLFKKDKIIEANKILVEMNLVSIHKNPNPEYSFDRTNFYLFNEGAVQALVDMDDTDTHSRFSDNADAIIRPTITKNTDIDKTRQDGDFSNAARSRNSSASRGKVFEKGYPDLPVEGETFIQFCRTLIPFIRGSRTEGYMRAVYETYTIGDQAGKLDSLVQQMTAYLKYKKARMEKRTLDPASLFRTLKSVDWPQIWLDYCADNGIKDSSIIPGPQTDEERAYKQFLASLPDKSQQ